MDKRTIEQINSDIDYCEDVDAHEGSNSALIDGLCANESHTEKNCGKCQRLAPQPYEMLEGLGSEEGWNQKIAAWWRDRPAHMGCLQCPFGLSA